MWGLQAVLQKLRKKQTGSTLDQGQLTQSEHDFPSKAPNVSLTEQAETSFALCWGLRSFAAEQWENLSKWMNADFTPLGRRHSTSN